MMRTTVIILVVCVSVIGCAVVQQTPRALNQRIVYRDLTRPKEVRLPVPKLEEPLEKPTAQPEPIQPQANKPSSFIEFANDSVTQFDEEPLKIFVKAAPSDTPILVVGHSHGQSAVGVLPLATQRAEAVKRWLIAKGCTNVHTMASWGKQTINFAPNRGVHVYLLKTSGDEMFIAFGKQTREATNDQFIDSIAAHTPETGMDGS